MHRQAHELHINVCMHSAARRRLITKTKKKEKKKIYAINKHQMPFILIYRAQPNTKTAPHREDSLATTQKTHMHTSRSHLSTPIVRLGLKVAVIYRVLYSRVIRKTDVKMCCIRLGRQWITQHTEHGKEVRAAATCCWVFLRW